MTHNYILCLFWKLKVRFGDPNTSFLSLCVSSDILSILFHWVPFLLPLKSFDFHMNVKINMHTCTSVMMSKIYFLVIIIKGFKSIKKKLCYHWYFCFSGNILNPNGWMDEPVIHQFTKFRKKIFSHFLYTFSPPFICFWREKRKKGEETPKFT